MASEETIQSAAEASAGCRHVIEKVEGYKGKVSSLSNSLTWVQLTLAMANRIN